MQIAEDTKQVQMSFVRLFFYWGMASVYLLSDVVRLSRWLPLNGPLLYSWVPSNLFSYEAMLIFKWVFVLACIVAGTGWRFKIFAPLAALSGFLFLLLCYSAGMSNHQNQLPALILILFALQSACPKKFSLGQLLFLARTSFCLVFFTAGASKVSELGMGWFDRDLHLSYLLINRFAYRSPFASDALDLNLFMIQNYEALKLMFYAALPAELLAPLALWRPFRFLILIYILMQVSAAFILYAVFLPYVPIYAIWLSDRNTAFFEEKFASLRRKLRTVLNK